MSEHLPEQWSQDHFVLRFPGIDARASGGVVLSDKDLEQLRDDITTALERMRNSA